MTWQKGTWGLGIWYNQNMNKTTVLCVAAALAATVFADANPFAGAKLTFTSDKSGFYAVGEPMRFTIRLDGVEGDVPEGCAVRWFRRGDDRGDKNDKCVDRGRFPLPLEEPCVYETSIDRPGFVHLGVYLVDAKGEKIKNAKGKPIEFDGGAGAAVEKIEGVGEPEDFDAFWAKRKERLASVPMVVDRRELPSNDGGVKIWAVSVRCAGARPMTGYLTIPADATTEKRYPAECVYDGYSATDVDRAPKGGPKDFIRLHINAHGYELGREKEYYKEFYDSVKSGGRDYAQDGAVNKNADWAYFCGMTYRVMRSTQFVKSLPEWNGRDLRVAGGSQGGLQTIWAAALDPDVTFARPNIPWCCDLGGRGKFGRIGGWRPNYTEALSYYDPVNLARRIPKTCRVLVTCGLGDYVCPPSGMCVLYNNLSCPKKIVWNQGQKHGGPPNPRIQEFSFKSEDYADGEW